jgi:hypothetical protein
MRLEKGQEVEGGLDMVMLIGPFASPVRHVLAAFSVAAPPRSIRERLTKALLAIKHRGSWFCTDDRGHVPEHFFNAASDHVNMVDDPLGWPRAFDPDGASEIAPAVRVGFGLARPDPSSSARYERNPN